MSRSIDISETHKEIVQAILREHLTTSCHVWVFGSRATWLAKEYSDLDLAIARKDGTALSLTVMSALETAFEDSLLPWKVDVIDLHSVSEEFRAAIERDKVLFSLGVGGEWKKTSLRELGVQLIDCDHKTPKEVQNGVPYIGIPQMNNGYIDFGAKPRLISEEDYVIWTRKADPQYGDIILSRRCNSGETAYVPKSVKFALGQNLVILRPTGDRLHPEFLRWAVQGKEWWDEVAKYLNPGAIFESLKCADIPKFQIPEPPKLQQISISTILTSMTDKIELNRQTNQTLEAMAQALFQSWFVDFDPVIDKALAAGNEIPEAFQAKAAARQALGDQRLALPEEVTALFPDSFVFTEEMGWVPEGWEVNPLAEIIEIIGGGTPKTSIKEYWDGDIPWFSVVDAPNSSDIFVIDTEKHITATGLKNSSTRLLNKGTTIISARGTVGKCAMVGKPMAMNQSCYGIHGKKDISNTYIYYSVLLSVSDLQRKSHGSVFGTITRDTFKLIQIPFCGEALSQIFDHYVKPSFEKILSNCNENISLTTLRDTLLPKLISGELRVADAGGFLGEVGV